ncbi:MAG: phage protein of unknown function DUF955 [Bacteroidetes bacterium HLUCCA01]|nr:MAG: phage protein of unknown function DUF955 [Bacteroidetes bacterium HLUCCA01]
MIFEETVNLTDRLAIDELLYRGKRFRGSKEFIKIVNFITRFNHYSRFNTILVYIQNQDVTFFGSASFWKKKFGRTVSEDARPYIILAPKGPIVLVYDLFDTKGYLSPEDFLEKGLGRKLSAVNGIVDGRVYQRVLLETKKWGIKVSQEPFSYFKGGHVTTIFSGRLEIALKKGLSESEAFCVLIHELAHLFLGHTGHKSILNDETKSSITLPQRILSKSAAELEAETVSYLICKKIGIEAQSAEYIAGYIKSENDLIQFSYEMVIKIADKIEKLFIKV